ncbi:hypothetical protein ACV566_09605 [Staphylococcus aureus]
MVIAKDIVSRYGTLIFTANTARPEYITEFRRHRLRAINADKSKLSGVEEVAKLFKQNKLLVLYDNMDRFKQEVFKYVGLKTEAYKRI